MGAPEDHEGSDALVDWVVAEAGRRTRWSALRAAGRALARAVGTELDEGALRLYAAPGDGDGDTAASVAPGSVDLDADGDRLNAALAMGACLEAVLAPDERHAGAHHTPPWLARRVVDLALDGLSPTGSTTVCDPACGGGVFAVTAADALLHRRLGDATPTDTDRAEVARCVWAFDTDPLAVAVTEVALALWAGTGDDGIVAGGLVTADFLLDGSVEASRPEAGWDVVVGNPPFQSQLATATARSRRRAEELRARFDAAAGGYVDEAALFLLAGARVLAAEGRMALIVPTALASTAHAAPVREALAERTVLAELWAPDEQPFTAAVDVMVPVLAAGGAADATVVHPSGAAAGDDAAPVLVPDPGADWADAVATAWGVPPAPSAGTSGTLSDRAAVTAGFRQHFYAVADAVREGGPGDATDRPVLTVGLVDPLRNRWGLADTRIGGTRFRRPVLPGATASDRAVIDASVAEWLEAR
ncbi:MAG: N-6 DNA methylase [Actinomycetota bacterium]